MKITIKTLVAAALASLFVACGPPTQEFVGLYESSGSHTLVVHTPDGNVTRVIENTDTMNVFEGATSDLVVRVDECNVPYNVEDFETALAVAGSTCTMTEDGTTITFTFRSGVISRSSQSVSTMTLKADLNLVQDGKSFTGTWSTNQTWTKASK